MYQRVSIETRNEQKRSDMLKAARELRSIATKIDEKVVQILTSNAEWFDNDAKAYVPLPFSRIFRPFQCYHSPTRRSIDEGPVGIESARESDKNSESADELEIRLVPVFEHANSTQRT